MGENTFGAVTLSVAQTVSLWTVLLPPVSEVRRHTPGRAPQFADDVRHAEMVAGSLAITVGAIMAVTEKDYRPLIASAVLVAAMIAAYEYTLQTNPGAQTAVTIIGEVQEND